MKEWARLYIRIPEPHHARGFLVTPWSPQPPPSKAGGIRLQSQCGQRPGPSPADSKPLPDSYTKRAMTIPAQKHHFSIFSRKIQSKGMLGHLPLSLSRHISQTLQQKVWQIWCLSDVMSFMETLEPSKRLLRKRK